MPALLDDKEETESDSEEDDSSDNCKSACKEQEEPVKPKDQPAETDMDKKVGQLPFLNQGLLNLEGCDISEGSTMQFPLSSSEP